jgi:hypothetical protein
MNNRQNTACQRNLNLSNFSFSLFVVISGLYLEVMARTTVKKAPKASKVKASTMKKAKASADKENKAVTLPSQKSDVLVTIQ